MSFTAPSRWFLFLHILFFIGVILIPFLAILCGWLLMKGFNPPKPWIPRTAFWLGAGWVTVFAFAYAYALNVFVGIGFESKLYMIVAVIALESASIGLLAYDSAWRLLALIPIVVGTYAIRPWLSVLKF